MRNFEFIDHDVLEMKYLKNLEEDDDLDIEVSVNYTLNFDEENRMAFGDVEMTIDDDQHAGKLMLYIHTVGVFSYLSDELTDDLRRRFHRESINILNPMWNELIFKMSEIAGIPPIELDTMELEDDDIVLQYGENLN